MELSLSITQANPDTLKRCIESLGNVVFLGEETRRSHTANYPMHNRYFSNGDTPWVILINHKNKMKLNYDGIEHIIHENELVCFDDNIMHAWEMKNNDMTIYYYSAKNLANPVHTGTYCIDSLRQ